MGYQIMNPTAARPSRETGLGVSFQNGNRLFSSIYLDINQAYENLKNLLLTRKGERILQPTFGTRLFNILFQPNVAELSGDIETVINEAVNFWLPYINLNIVDVVTNLDDPNLVHHVSIRITFSLNDFETKTITLNVTDTGTIEVE